MLKKIVGSDLEKQAALAQRELLEIKVKLENLQRQVFVILQVSLIIYWQFFKKSPVLKYPGIRTDSSF